LVYLWSVLRELDQEDPEVIKEAKKCVVDMMLYAHRRGRKCVGLGQAMLVGIMDMIRMVNTSIKELDEKHPNEPTGYDTLRKILMHTEVEQEK
jgi:hypothetical protein